MRRGGLFWVAMALLFLLALSALARALVMTGTEHAAIERVSGLLVWALVAFVAAAVVLIAFRAATAVLRRQGSRGSRALRHVETFAALLVAGLAVAVYAGRITGVLVGVGILGFGLTLALQRPILAMAGWAVVRFGRLFREGDRIEVAGIAGDVVDVRLLFTRIWEIGTQASPVASGAESSPLRPTGRVVTVSNAVFLENAVANATGDFGFVFDEFAVSVAYEADRLFAEAELRRIAHEAIDPEVHRRAAQAYADVMHGKPLEARFPKEPEVLLMLRDDWIELRLRYLVEAHRRGVARSRLARAWAEATEAAPDRLPNVYRRVQTMHVGGDGRALARPPQP